MRIRHNLRDGFSAVNADARYWQILALTTLFALSHVISDFGASYTALGAAFIGALVAQLLGSWAIRAPMEWQSAVITALGLAILLRATSPAFWLVAGLVGVGAKFLIRFRGKHLVNPACLGIVIVTLSSTGAWISPGQWGQAPIVAAFTLGFAALVLSSARRLDIALGFLGFFAGLMFARAAWLGDPLMIPVHQMQNGALLVFAFFMITDPRSTPDSRAGRLLFAACVAGLAAWLSWGPHVRGGMVYALAILGPLTLIIDQLLPDARFQWTDDSNKEKPNAIAINSAGDNMSARITGT